MKSRRRAWIGLGAIVVGAVAGGLCVRAEAQDRLADRDAHVQGGALRERLEDYVSRIGAFGFSGAVLVIKGDDVLVMRGCGLADREASVPNTPGTLFDVGSVTKSFTAAAVVKLESAGRLRVSDPIGVYLRSVPEDKRGITTHHLLTHTSGLPRGVAMQGEAAENRGAATSRILGLPLEFEPGERWSYSNTGYQLLACLVEEITGEPFEDHLKRELFRPARMTHTGFVRDPAMAAEPVAIGYSPDFPGGVVGRADEQWYHWGLRGCGGVLTSLQDLMRWELALRAETVLSEAEQERLFSPHHASHGTGWFYGYGWDVTGEFLPGLRTSFVGHGGDTRGFECKLYRFPEEELAIAVLSNTNDHHAWWVPNHLIAILFGRPYSVPPAVVPLAREALDALEGEYRADEATLLVRRRGDAMRVVPLGQKAIELLAMLPEPAATAPEARRSNLRADAALRAWADRDVDALGEMLDPQWPDWARRLSEWIDQEAAQRAGFRRHRVVGTTGSGRGRTTWVDLEFGSGAELAWLGWNGDLITAFQLPARGDIGAAFLPGAEGRFNAFDIATGRAMTLEFIAEGDRTRAALTTADGQIVTLERTAETHAGADAPGR